MMSESDIQTSLDGHRRRNEELLKNLAAQNKPLDEPQSVQFFFVARSQRDAALLAREMYSRNLMVLAIAPSPASANDSNARTWNIEVGARRTLAEAASDTVSEEWQRLAAKFDADYDGWGASI